MDNVTEYSIIESDAHAELVEAVNEALREGRQPHGGLVIWREPLGVKLTGNVATPAAAIVHYAQALVKYGP
ncbi:MAG: hypothetical protein AUI15_05900 [Actinobacteria bacterium 13_2_20CM_2_66_6]|nr:MAG: hypothetical protein AUI15_05900 [Actinobacteria bacterium 13_2_20CM_2_66_6]